MRIIRPADLEVLATPPAGIDQIAGEFSFHVSIAGIAMRMRFDDPGLRERFARRYREHAIAPAQPALTFSCAWLDDSYYFWSSAVSTVWRWPGALPPHALTLLIDATSMASLVRSDPALLSFHAAAVACEGGAAAIVGDSTAGKTTTTIACARRGMSPYSDERLLLRDASVLPFMRAFNLRPGGRALLRRDDDDDDFARAMADAPESDDWTDVSPFEVIRGLCRPEPAPLSAIFVLQGAGTTASLTKLEPRRATPALMSSADCAATSMLERAARTMATLRNTSVFGLTLGTPAATAELIETTVRELTSRAA